MPPRDGGVQEQSPEQPSASQEPAVLEDVDDSSTQKGDECAVGDILQPLEANASNRGVAIGWFLNEFLALLEGDATFEGGLAEHTTKDVVMERIMPDTLSGRCSYVQLPGVQTSKPHYFVSHTWHRPFRELKTCLQERFAGVDPATVVWIDIFAVSELTPATTISAANHVRSRASFRVLSGSLSLRQ
jgi:hypothetical protein